MTIADIDKLRIEIGGAALTDQLFTEDELSYFLDTHPSVLAAAAAACDVLATRFASDFDFKWKDQAFTRSQRSKMFAARATALRERADGGIGVTHTCRDDRGLRGAIPASSSAPGPGVTVYGDIFEPDQP